MLTRQTKEVTFSSINNDSQQKNAEKEKLHDETIKKYEEQDRIFRELFKILEPEMKSKTIKPEFGIQNNDSSNSEVALTSYDKLVAIVASLKSEVNHFRAEANFDTSKLSYVNARGSEGISQTSKDATTQFNTLPLHRRLW